MTSTFLYEYNFQILLNLQKTRNPDRQTNERLKVHQGFVNPAMRTMNIPDKSQSSPDRVLQWGWQGLFCQFCLSRSFAIDRAGTIAGVCCCCLDRLLWIRIMCSVSHHVQCFASCAVFRIMCSVSHHVLGMGPVSLTLDYQRYTCLLGVPL